MIMIMKNDENDQDNKGLFFLLQLYNLQCTTLPWDGLMVVLFVEC
jgi:hypothetical protein